MSPAPSAAAHGGKMPRSMRKRIEPVGAIEIGERLGVKPRTVSTWWARTQARQMPLPMPPPRTTVSGQPAWDWPEIERWDRARKREQLSA